MKYFYFINLFIIINIALCSCFITGFFDFSNLIIKSHNMTFYNPLSVLTITDKLITKVSQLLELVIIVAARAAGL